MSGPRSLRCARPTATRGPWGRPGERGVTWVSVLLLLLVAGSAYLGWVWLPLYFDHFAVKQVVSDYMNQAVKNRDDAELVHNMVSKLHLLRHLDTVEPSGRRARVPAIPLEESAVTWERDQEAKTLHIAFEYERQVVYPFLDRTDVVVFTVDRTGDISLPDWGPAR